MAPARPAAIPVRRLARPGDRRRGEPRADPIARDPARLGERVDLAHRRCRPAGDRDRLGGPEAVPLQRAPSGGASTREVRPAPSFCARAADAPGECRERPPARAVRAGMGVRDRDRPGQQGVVPGRVRPAHARLADVRRHDLAEASRRSGRRRDPLCLQDEEQRARPPHAAERSPRTGAGAPGGAGRITAVQVRTGRRARRSPRTASTTTSGSGSETISPRRTSAPGAGRSSRRASSHGTARRRASETRSGCWGS